MAQGELKCKMQFFLGSESSVRHKPCLDKGPVGPSLVGGRSVAGVHFAAALALAVRRKLCLDTRPDRAFTRERPKRNRPSRVGDEAQWHWLMPADPWDQLAYNERREGPTGPLSKHC